MPNVFSPIDLVSRPDNMDKTHSLVTSGEQIVLRPEQMPRLAHRLFYFISMLWCKASAL